MGSKKTPLILKLRDTGGTLYVFPSASEDIGLNLQSTTTGVAMSHYALLDIPSLSISKCLCNSSTAALNGNEALAMSLQNYMMNFETYLTNQEDYNYQALNTVSEKVFWHWALKIGIINASNFTNVSDDTSIFKEKGHDSSSMTIDNTVIKCFGSIDAGNTLSTEFGMYNETYINIPTSYGAGPVYLKLSSDTNYTLNSVYQLDDPTHLEGRGDEYLYYSYTKGQDIPFVDDISTGSYIVNDDFDGLEILKDIPTILEVAKKDYNDDSIVISSYDDLNIDINGKFNADIKFDFNAILLYYSVYDQDDIIKTSYATNLFGIIFLDGCKQNASADSFYIPKNRKLKSTTTSFGDSFSFRVNLKTMSVYDNTDAIIQDNTTMSSIASVDFSDAISNLNKAIDIMNTNVHVTESIQDKYAQIMSFYDQQAQKIEDISTTLDAYLKGARTSVVDTNALYTNIIAPNPTNASNNIIISTIGAVTGSDVLLNDTAIEINTDGVDIPTLNNSTFKTHKSYVYEDLKSESDPAIYSELPGTQTYTDYIESAINTLDAMFNSYENLVIRTKKDISFITTTGIQHDKVKNQLYIDSSSMLFNNTNVNLATIKYLRDGEYINYLGFIPYLIYQVQTLTQKDTSILQYIDDKVSELDSSISARLSDIENSIANIDASIADLNDRVKNIEEGESSYVDRDQADEVNDILTSLTTLNNDLNDIDYKKTTVKDATKLAEEILG